MENKASEQNKLNFKQNYTKSNGNKNKNKTRKVTENGTRKENNEEQKDYIGMRTRSSQKSNFVLEKVFNACQFNDPTSFKEALASPHAEDWYDAMKEEFNCLMKYKTWTLCDLFQGKTVIGGRWVFKTKYLRNGSVNRQKANKALNV